MTGSGNDFIVVDSYDEDLILEGERVRELCARRTGIGADGMLFLRKPESEGHHFRMQYFNADGNEVEMCGNGACVMSHFYHELVNKGEYTFETQNGVYTSQVQGDSVKLLMTKLSEQGAIEVDDLLDCRFSYYINTGVPHCVYEVEDLQKCPVESWGAVVRSDKRFERGVNCNFFELVGEKIHIRTFERGVEGETLACGTGVVAVALALYLRGDRRRTYWVRVPGGEVAVEVESLERVFFCGKVAKIFHGTFVLTS